MKTVGIANLTPEEDRRQRLRVQLIQDSRNVSVLLDLLADIVEARDWEEAGLTFVAYLESSYEEGGVGWSVDNFKTILHLKHDLEREGRESPPTVERMARMRTRVTDLLTDKLDPHGVNQHSGRNNITSSTVRGTSPDYTLRRLKRDAPELAAKVVNGELTANHAAQQAGFRKKTITVPVEPQSAARAIQRHFTPEQVREIVRILGNW